MWLERWEEHQALYLPGRAHAIVSSLDVVEAVVPSGDRPVRLLDLAGGPGTVAQAAAERFPDADVVVADIDPVLLAMARAEIDARGLGARISVTQVDLASPGWTHDVGGTFDVVIVVLALHYFDADRLRRIYAELRDVLRPGGILLTSDRMPEPGLTRTTRAIDDAETERRQRLAAGGTADWAQWWASIEHEPSFASELAERRRRLEGRSSAEFHPDIGWHTDALDAAGFEEVGVTWRHLTSATLCARSRPANPG